MSFDRAAAKVTGKISAWIHNKMYLSNSYFRKRAFRRDVFTAPDYKSFFVMVDNVPDGGDLKMTSEQPFPRELVEVVKIDEFLRCCYESAAKATEL